MKYDERSDIFLLEKCSEQDQHAFRELYGRYKSFVESCVKMRVSDPDAIKDITQDIFLNLWNSQDELIHVKNLKAYLYVVSRNQATSAFRSCIKRSSKESHNRSNSALYQSSAEEDTISAELMNHLNKVLGKLPITMRDCYLLSKHEGKNNHEIASFLKISEKTVRNNVSEALNRLRNTFVTSVSF